MAIREEFGQAVIGTEQSDLDSVLLQIHRPQINLVSAYYPLHRESAAYLQGIGIEDNFIKAGRGNDSGYGRDVAYFVYEPGPGRMSASAENVLPKTPGYDALVDDVFKRSARMSEISGTPVRAMIRLLDGDKNNLVTHVDNKVSYRGLQTLIGEGRTLYLPDRFVDLDRLYCEYDEAGNLCSNGLRTAFREQALHRQIDEHHMSIHKGTNFSNPLFHAAPAKIPALGLNVGVRALLTLDMPD